MSRFEYQIYDKDLYGTGHVDRQVMTVKEFKMYKKITTGTWMQFGKLRKWRVEIFSEDPKGFVELDEDGTIDFSTKPLVKITMVHV